MDIDFMQFDEIFLEKSYKWLTDPEIRAMTCTPFITKEGQKSWYESLSYRKDYYVWGIRKDREAIGAVGLKNIDYENQTGEYFGYIGEKQYWGMGIGMEMLIFMKEKAKELGINTLKLKVHPSNTRAIYLYKKFGFRILENFQPVFEGAELQMEYHIMKLNQ